MGPRRRKEADHPLLQRFLFPVQQQSLHNDPVGLTPPSMNLSIPSILLSLGSKCLLNWLLVFLQREHICRTFVGVFSASLSFVDTTLTLVLAAIYLHSDGQFLLLGLRLTRYHICLLVQIVGQVYGAVLLPVIVVAILDHLCTVSQRLQLVASRRKWMVHLMVTTLLWYLAVFYVFLLSNFVPVLENVPHDQLRQCWTFQSSPILHVAALLFLTLVYAALHSAHSRRLRIPPIQDQSPDQSRTDAQRSVPSSVLHVFLNTRARVFVALAMLLLVSVAMPSYLGLNAAWLCFLNSFLIGAVLSVDGPTLHEVNTLPPDSFCGWRFKFSLAAENSDTFNQVPTSEGFFQR